MTMVETVSFRTTQGCAILVQNLRRTPLAHLSRGAGSFAAEGLRIRPINYQLLAFRCGQRSLVGNGFIRSAVMVWSAPTGRATAKNVSAQCKCASEKPPLKKCVCLTANDLITPHPSQATPSPQATQGKAMTKPRLRTVVLTASVDVTKRNG